MALRANLQSLISHMTPSASRRNANSVHDEVVSGPWIAARKGPCMFAYEIRQAIEAAPRTKLPDVAALLWRALADRHVTEAEAEALSGLIDARQAPPSTPRPAPRRVGSRPITDASVERRRRWAASGRMPPAVAAKFTAGETAALAVVAVEVQRTGSCRWPLARIAAVGGVSVSTVKRAIRAARALGLVEVEVRRVAMWRNLPSVITISCKAWSAWLSRGGGVQPWPRSITQSSNQSIETAGNVAKGHRRQRQGGTKRQDGPAMRFPARTEPPTPSERQM